MTPWKILDSASFVEWTLCSFVRSVNSQLCNSKNLQKWSKTNRGMWRKVKKLEEGTWDHIEETISRRSIFPYWEAVKVKDENESASENESECGAT